jgi:hypothetical protein
MLAVAALIDFRHCIKSARNSIKKSITDWKINYPKTPDNLQEAPTKNFKKIHPVVSISINKSFSSIKGFLTRIGKGKGREGVASRV